MKTMKNTTSRLLLLGFGAGIAAACASAPPPPPPKPVETVQKPVEAAPADPLASANQLFAKGELESALRAYEGLLKTDPNSVPGLYNRALTLHKLGKKDQAQRAYEEVLAKDPEHLEATVNLGAILRDEGKTDEAIRIYNKKLEKDPYNPKLLNNLVVLYRAKKNYPKAIDTVRKLLMRDQKNIDAYSNLALVYLDQGKVKLAQTILGNAIKMAKDQKAENADLHVNLGLSHLTLGDNGKAMASFKEAVRINPKHVYGNYNIGALALAHRDYDLAARSLEVVSAAYPDDAEVIAALGYAYQGQQKLPDAAKQLEKAKAIKDGEQLNYQLMVIYQGSNEAEKALKFADEVLKIQGKTCGEKDYDGICGRRRGIEMMIKMKNAPAPAEEEKKVKATGKDIFTDAPAEGDDAAAPPPEEGAEGAAPAPGAPAPAPGAPAPQGEKKEEAPADKPK